MGLQKIPLDVSAQVTLNSAGAGTVRLGPNRLLQTWLPNNAAVFVSSNTNEPVAKIYLGSPVPANLLGGTASGSNDSTELNCTVRTGNVITCVWTGGDAGAIATLSLYGDILTGRP